MHTISSIVAIKAIAGKSALWTLPKVQNTTSATFVLSAKYSTRATRPPKKIAIAIPDKIIVVGPKFFSLEMQNISSVGIRANINAKITITTEEAANVPPTHIIAMQAPHDAPWETPIVDGAAKGLDKLLCKMHPQIPRAAPAIKEHKTCGNLRFTIINDAWLFGSEIALLSRSMKLMSDEPVAKLIATSNSVIIRVAITAHHFFLESLL